MMFKEKQNIKFKEKNNLFNIEKAITLTFCTRLFAVLRYVLNNMFI